MPKILERLVSQLQSKGKSQHEAYAIATSQLQKHGELKKGSTKATAKGIARGNMTPAARAKDRASKASRAGVSKISNHKPSAYKYNPNTNLAKLK